MIRAALTGSSWLGVPTPQPTPVVLVTEEGESALVEGLRVAGLTDAPGLHIVTLFEVRAHEWPAIVAALLAQARQVGSRFVCVDTLPAIAGIEGEAENQSGAALAIMRPLAELTAAGLGCS